MDQLPDQDFMLDSVESTLAAIRQAIGSMRSAADHLEDVATMLGGTQRANSARLAILIKLEHGEQSRMDLLKGVGLNRASAWSLVQTMEREGLLEIETRQTSTRGRPTQFVRLTERGWEEIRADYAAKGIAHEAPALK